MSFSSYSVDNDKKFRDALRNAFTQVKDLRLPLTLIGRDWFDSNRAIFALKSPGQYPDLKPATKKQKQKQTGFIYPILERTGRLSASITQPANSDAIDLIVNKNTLILGTKVPYGVYHQSDKPRKKIPLRKFVFIGPESTFAADTEISGRLERWTGILERYVLEKMKQQGFKTT